MDIPRWHGLRVVAADASKMRLFLQDATSSKVREAIAFALYLPGLEMTLAAKLYSPTMGERQMLFEHLEYLLPGDLLVLDRGYPARWLDCPFCTTQHPFLYVCRCFGFRGCQSVLAVWQAGIRRDGAGAGCDRRG